MEHVSADVSTSSEERIDFLEPSSGHFYATWLFNLSDSAQDTHLIFMNGSDSEQEGPRIDIEDQDAGLRAAVRAGGPSGSDVEIDIEFNKTFRIELISSLAPQGFEYSTPTETRTVAEDTFDLYVSAPGGHLVGAATGLSFRDGSNVVEALSSMRLAFPNTPNITFDDWEITDGQIQGNGYLAANHINFGDAPSSNFFNLAVEEQDQDNDGIPDWEELALAAHYKATLFRLRNHERHCGREPASITPFRSKR